MIQTKKDLERYLNVDKKALGISKKYPPIFGNEVWKYQIALRKEEYYTFNQSNIINIFKLKFWRKVHHYYGLLLGFDIPICVFGAGLKINHYGNIVVNGNTRVGEFCDIHQGVNIGQNGLLQTDCPTIGNNVWIGPGAKIFGNIEIANNIMIGANSVVTKSFKQNSITIAGVPAVKIKERGNIYGK